MQDRRAAPPVNETWGLQVQLDAEITAHRRLLQVMLADQAVEAM